MKTSVSNETAIFLNILHNTDTDTVFLTMRRCKTFAMIQRSVWISATKIWNSREFLCRVKTDTQKIWNLREETEITQFSGLGTGR